MSLTEHAIAVGIFLIYVILILKGAWNIVKNRRPRPPEKGFGLF